MLLSSSSAKHSSPSSDSDIQIIESESQSSPLKKSSVSSPSTKIPDPDLATETLAALSGHGLFKKAHKAEAVYEFLKLSSMVGVFFSHNETILKKAEGLCQAPREALKKKTKKSPMETWTSAFCAKFIISVAQLIDEDNKERHGKTSPRRAKVLKPVQTILDMYLAASSKAQNNLKSSKQSKKTKPSVGDYLLRSFPASNIEIVTSSMIEKHLCCPSCKHYSLISTVPQKEIDNANKQGEEDFKTRLDNWEKLKHGPKPRAKKTSGQILACICYKQNCLCNADGVGCFKCEIAKGEVPMMQDPK